MNLHVSILWQQPLELVHPFDVALDFLARQAAFALHRHSSIAINHQEVDLDRLAATTRGHAAVDFADIQPARTKEVDQRGFDHRLDELAQAVAQIAKAS
jgi:N-acyl-D-aspartate/D-glutamate deacylase